MSPPPSQGAAPPLMDYEAPTVGAGARRDLRQQRILGGVVLLVIGLVVTVGTYTLAASNPSGGTYFIAFGPVLLGIYVIAKGLTTPAGISAPTRRPRTR